jgi:Phospholipase_D-nuclease N-terminal
MLATNWTFMNVMWSMFAFFAWVLWISLVITALYDNFHRADTSGVAKVGWMLLIIFLPLIGLIIYMAARPSVVKGAA